MGERGQVSNVDGAEKMALTGNQSWWYTVNSIP